MSCRVAMLRMHREPHAGATPAPLQRHPAPPSHPAGEPEDHRPPTLPALQVRPLADQREAQLWREYVDRYHYLGYTPLPGAQMRYLVTSQRRVLAVRLWRQRLEGGCFIGWSVAQREARLQLVVNNARFLILLGAGAQSRFHVAAGCPTTGRLAIHLRAVRPLPRYHRAANWILGDVQRCPTSGSTRSGATSAADSAPRSIHPNQ